MNIKALLFLAFVPALALGQKSKQQKKQSRASAPLWQASPIGNRENFVDNERGIILHRVDGTHFINLDHYTWLKEKMTTQISTNKDYSYDLRLIEDPLNPFYYDPKNTVKITYSLPETRTEWFIDFKPEYESVFKVHLLSTNKGKIVEKSYPLYLNTNKEVDTKLTYVEGKQVLSYPDVVITQKLENSVKEYRESIRISTDSLYRFTAERNKHQAILENYKKEGYKEGFNNELFNWNLIKSRISFTMNCGDADTKCYKHGKCRNLLCTESTWSKYMSFHMSFYNVVLTTNYWTEYAYIAAGGTAGNSNATGWNTNKCIKASEVPIFEFFRQPENLTRLTEAYINAHLAEYEKPVIFSQGKVDLYIKEIDRSRDYVSKALYALNDWVVSIGKVERIEEVRREDSDKLFVIETFQPKYESPNYDKVSNTFSFLIMDYNALGGGSGLKTFNAKNLLVRTKSEENTFGYANLNKYARDFDNFVDISQLPPNPENNQDQTFAFADLKLYNKANPHQVRKAADALGMKMIFQYEKTYPNAYAAFKTNISVGEWDFETDKALTNLCANQGEVDMLSLYVKPADPQLTITLQPESMDKLHMRGGRWLNTNGLPAGKLTFVTNYVMQETGIARTFSINIANSPLLPSGDDLILSLPKEQSRFSLNEHYNVAHLNLVWMHLAEGATGAVGGDIITVPSGDKGRYKGVATYKYNMLNKCYYVGQAVDSKEVVKSIKVDLDRSMNIDSDKITHNKYLCEGEEQKVFVLPDPNLMSNDYYYVIKNGYMDKVGIFDYNSFNFNPDGTLNYNYKYPKDLPFQETLFVQKVRKSDGRTSVPLALKYQEFQLSDGQIFSSVERIPLGHQVMMWYGDKSVKPENKPVYTWKIGQDDPFVTSDPIMYYYFNYVGKQDISLKVKYNELDEQGKIAKTCNKKYEQPARLEVYDQEAEYLASIVLGEAKPLPDIDYSVYEGKVHIKLPRLFDVKLWIVDRPMLQFLHKEVLKDTKDVYIDLDPGYAEQGVHIILSSLNGKDIYFYKRVIW